MSAPLLRRSRRAVARALARALTRHAARSGPDRIRQIGERIGALHHFLSLPVHGRLARDMARALDCDLAEAKRILAASYRINDRAVFEVLTLAEPECDAAALVDAVEIEHIDRLPPPGRAAVLLGMHMGNGILMASKLARAGWPVHVVAREPRRLVEGTLSTAIANGGATPLALDRANPTRSFRQMLRVLRDGGLLYVLMDQGNKGEGVPRRFLGKPMNMPGGVPGLAIRAGVPVIPVHLQDAGAHWRFRVEAPLRADDEDGMLDAICASMEARVRSAPELWSWHQRRWKRYDFESTRDHPERS